MTIEFKDLTVRELLTNGTAMKENGWTIVGQFTIERKFVWVSPRGTPYKANSVDVPPWQAVQNAQINNDYPTTLMLRESDAS